MRTLIRQPSSFGNDQVEPSGVAEHGATHRAARMAYLDRDTRINRLIVMAIDSVIVAGSALLSWRLIFGAFNGSYLLTSCAVTLLILVSMAFGSIYMIRAWTRWQVLYEGAKVLCVSGFLLVTARCLVPDVSFHVGLLTQVISGTCLIGWRLAFFVPLRSAITMRLAITDGAAKELMRAPGSNVSRKNGLEIVGVIGANTSHVFSEQDAPWPMSLKARASRPYDAVVAGPLDAAHLLPSGVPIVPFVEAFEGLTARIPVDHIDETWFVRSDALEQRFAYRVGKRALDVAIASIGLVLTALLFPVLAIAIKLSGPGPIFYSQARVGRLGYEFRMYKFRTMRVDAERDGAVWAAVNDQRVTKTGAFLRRTRLDELPQFWNVLRGEMSLIGPRPERPEFVATLAEHIPFYHRRHAVLPGVTGWAQVMFPYGASIEDAKEKLQYDFFYVNNRSFYLDLKILLRTVFVMLGKFGSR